MHPVTDTSATSPQQPPRRKRADSFLGVHFDFHARMIDQAIGRFTTPEMIANLIDQVHPDYLQIDCKGHFGVSSYPTKVGNPAPSFVGDPLRTWRKVTAERGVALYVHYSGVADDRVIQLHPEWAAIDSDGKPSVRATSLFSPYAERLLIPQLNELAGDYGVDGCWVDGDCWTAIPDYSEPALREFHSATGIAEVPRRPDDPHWAEFMSFNREAFRRYLRHYTAELHRTQPAFQVASNWAFSDHMPEPVSADVDFLSGDYSMQNSVNWARFTARSLENQGRPWDLMAWSFVHRTVETPAGKKREPGIHVKSIPQLEQEAAIVLSRGGGFQGYFIQQSDGSIYDWQMPTMAAVARFCRERQAICHRAVAVPQVALLYSTAAHYRQSPRLFAPVSPTATAVRGVLQGLLDCQQSVQIVNEHHLQGRMADWPVIVVPETEYLDPGFRAELAAYARSGGNLLVIGPRAAALFRDEIGYTSLPPPPAGEISAHLEHDGRMAAMLTPWENVQLAPTATPFGRLYRHDNPRNAPDPGRGVFGPAGSISPLGRGRVAATYLDFGERYLNGRDIVARDFLRALVHEIFPQPMVEVTGSRLVDVSVMRQGKKLAVNLVNTAGPHENLACYDFDEIPSVGPLAVTIHVAPMPRRVTVEPGARPVAFEYRGGAVTLTLSRLERHEIVVVEPWP